MRRWRCLHGPYVSWPGFSAAPGLFRSASVFTPRSAFYQHEGVRRFAEQRIAVKSLNTSYCAWARGTHDWRARSPRRLGVPAGGDSNVANAASVPPAPGGSRHDRLPGEALVSSSPSVARRCVPEPRENRHQYIIGFVGYSVPERPRQPVPTAASTRTQIKVDRELVAAVGEAV